MDTNIRRNRKLLGALTGLALVAVAGIASAAGIRFLFPGASGVIAGISAAADPSLNGTVIASQSLAFSCGGIQGTLDNYVLQNTAGTLDFYFHVTNDPTSTPIPDVTSFDFTPVAAVGVAWRPDLAGTVIPDSASRTPAPGAGVRVNFTVTPINPGQDSRYVFLRSSLVSFNAAGVTLVGGCPVNGTYQPL